MSTELILWTSGNGGPVEHRIFDSSFDLYDFLETGAFAPETRMWNFTPENEAWYSNWEHHEENLLAINSDCLYARHTKSVPTEIRALALLLV